MQCGNKVDILAVRTGARMSPGLSDSDWDRIRQFAEKSVFDRNPDMLVPPGEDDERE